MEELYDTIEQYLQGTLPEDQRQDFERRLKTDAQLQEEVDAFRVVGEVIEEGIADQLRTDFKQWNNAKPMRVISLRRVLAVAASVAILIMAIGFWQVQQNFSSEALASNFYEDLETTGTRAITNEESILNEALKAYQDADYSKAVSTLEDIPDTNAYYLDAQLLLAKSQYQLGDLETVIATAQKLQKNTDTSLQEQADWMVLMAYLKGGQKDSDPFRNLLAQMVNNPSHSFHPKALQLQDKLHSFWVNFAN